MDNNKPKNFYFELYEQKREYDKYDKEIEKTWLCSECGRENEPGEMNCVTCNYPRNGY